MFLYIYDDLKLIWSKRKNMPVSLNTAGVNFNGNPYNVNNKDESAPIPPQQPDSVSFSSKQPIKKGHPILIGAVALAGIIGAIVLYPRASYLVRNIGKKGLSNLEGEAKTVWEKLKHIEGIKEITDKMSTRNLTRLAETMKGKEEAFGQVLSGKFIIKGEKELIPLISTKGLSGYALSKQVRAADGFIKPFQVKEFDRIKEGQLPGLMSIKPGNKNNYFDLEAIYPDKEKPDNGICIPMEICWSELPEVIRSHIIKTGNKEIHIYDSDFIK